MTAAYVADTDAPRARPARPRAARERVDRRDHRRDRSARRRAGTPTPPAATSTSACARTPAYGGLSRALARRDGPGRGRRGRRRDKEDPLDFALWKAQKAGRGRGLGLALGARAARLAHRVLGDGRGAARRRLRHPRRRLDLLFPHHENEAAQTRCARGAELALLLAAQRDARARRRREDGEVGRQHRAAARGDRPARAATR